MAQIDVTKAFVDSITQVSSFLSIFLFATVVDKQGAGSFDLPAIN